MMVKPSEVGVALRLPVHLRTFGTGDDKGQFEKVPQALIHDRLQNQYKIVAVVSIESRAYRRYEKRTL